MKLSIYSYIGYAFIIFSLIAWQLFGFDNIILGMLIFGGCLLLRDIIVYYRKKKVISRST